jgi:hypothetical protein
MDLKERLKKVEFDPLYKVSLTDDVSKSWQRNNNIKLFLANEILNILKEIYEPLGMWGQNPRESQKRDYGVIIDNDWSPLMQADTNWSGHSIIFNRCNKFIVNNYRILGKESFDIDGETFSYKNQIVFNIDDDEKETIDKIKKILKIVKHKKNEIFLMGTPMYDNLISLFRKTMGIGDEAQHFYETKIRDFFPDIIDYKSTKGRGDYEDRKQGVDVWKTHKDFKTTDQIKSVCNIYKKKDGWFIDVAISQNSKCTYYVFVCLESRIMVFKNDKTKIVIEEDGVFFPDELLYKDKLYDK